MRDTEKAKERGRVRERDSERDRQNGRASWRQRWCDSEKTRGNDRTLTEDRKQYNKEIIKDHKFI